MPKTESLQTAIHLKSLVFFDNFIGASQNAPINAGKVTTFSQNGKD
ncbi:MAG: hypothetical protein H7A33_04950 [Deltaproteobacteria bacterium]|nr:hypothetical protein [Deltaproteobacteria bacterium]